ncbi:MAG: hypothetical protein GF346_03185 [Candidatus Eisenbacteria bacterium]|nr:hypothetical protein [Candidatus Latescibacterota bacterium]MBD3301425.1 hypothetical protein [Candidatus Eisenbacteria bacterium]
MRGGGRTVPRPCGHDRISLREASTMRKLSFLVLTAALAVFVGALVLPSFSVAEEGEEEAKFKFVGEAKCKFCHQGEKNGKIYEQWQASDHAKAFESLGEAHQGDEACLKCHTTGFGEPMAAGATAKKLQGVQCEACHGPGSEYKAMKVMKSHELSLENGLVVPDEELCKSCHVAELPQECWAGADASPSFDYAEAYKAIEHHVPEEK